MQVEYGAKITFQNLRQEFMIRKLTKTRSFSKKIQKARGEKAKEFHLDFEGFITMNRPPST